MELNSIKTDKIKETEGVVHHIGGGGWVKVARMNNSKFMVLVKEAKREIELSNSLITLSPEEDARKFNVILAKSILVEWGGIEEDGKDLPCTLENKIRVLEEISVLKELVLKIATEFENFKIKADEVDSGNLEQGYVGT